MTIQGDGSWGSITWPYPQVRPTDYYMIGLALDGNNLKVYELVCISDTWTAYEVYDLGASADIDYVDIQGWNKFYVVTASKMVGTTMTLTSFMRNPDGSTTALPTAAVPRFSAICNYKGQALVGGIASVTPPWDELGLASVAWSGIGSFDFRPTEGNNTTAGFTTLEAVGEGTGRVMRLMRLGSQVMAYTDQAVHKLLPFAAGRGGYVDEPLDNAGIASANHMTGSKNIHLHLDTNNDLWLTGKQGEPELLGYREFMEGLTTSEVRMSYVPSKKFFYISDSSTGYVLTEHGLYSCHQLVTSSGDYRGNVLCGFYDDTQDREPRFTSDTLDFGIRAFKTLSSVQADASYSEGADELYASCLFRSSYQARNFSQSRWIRLNPMGIATLMVTSNEFRIRLKGVDYKHSNLNLSRLDMRANLVDKRGIRGISNATKTNA